LNFLLFKIKGINKSEIIKELVFHGHNKTKIISGKQRNKEQANNELLEHYEHFHNDFIKNSENDFEEEDISIDID
jgi:hypothetical protein